MPWKFTLSVVIVAILLIPLSQGYKLLEQYMQPRRSGRRFLAWLALVLAGVFVCSFLLVLVVSALLRRG